MSDTITRDRRTKRERQTVLRVIDNPLFNPAYRESRTNPRTIEVDVSLSTDPVERMYQRGDLDHAQHTTCRRFLDIYQKAHTGAQSIDLTRPVVDTGNLLNGSHGPSMDVLGALQEVRRELGRTGYQFVTLVCGDGFAVKDAAAVMMGKPPTAADCTYFGRYFRDCVDALARHWGYKANGS